MADLSKIPLIGVNGKPESKSAKKAPTVKKPNGALKPSDSATNVTPVPKNTASKKSISGLPLDIKVKTGQGFTTPIYTPDSPQITYSTLDNAGRANLLYQMSKIKGLYSKNDPLAGATAESFIRSQGNAVTFRPEDFAALGKLMAHADQSGKTYTDSIQQFISAPTLAQSYFGTPTTAKKIVLSNPTDLQLDINNKFMDMFDTPVDKKTAQAYSNEVLKAEQSVGGANNLSQTAIESIFHKYIVNKANTLINAATTPDGKTQKITAGAFGTTINKIRSAYADNYITADDKKVYKDAIDATRSSQALQNTLQNISVKAAQYYPAIADGIKNGQSVSDLLDAPISSYATTFGIKANQVPQNFLSKIAGGTSILPKEEVDKVIWNSDGIEKTQAYQQMRANDMRTMIQTFGLGPI